MARLITLILLLSLGTVKAQIDSSRWSLELFLGGGAQANFSYNHDVNLFQTSRIGWIGGVGLGYHTRNNWNFYLTANLQEYDVSDAVITSLTDQFSQSDDFYLIEEPNTAGLYRHYQLMAGAGRTWSINNVELEPVLSFGIAETDASTAYRWKTKQMGSNYQRVHEFNFNNQNSSFIGRLRLAARVSVLEEKRAVWQLGVKTGFSVQQMKLSGNLMERDILGEESIQILTSEGYVMLFFFGIGGRVRF